MKTIFYAFTAYLTFGTAFAYTVTFPIQNDAGTTLSCTASTQTGGALESCPNVEPSKAGKATWTLGSCSGGGDEYQCWAVGTIEYQLENQVACAVSFNILMTYDSVYHWNDYHVTTEAEGYTCKINAPPNSTSTGPLLTIAPK